MQNLQEGKAYDIIYHNMNKFKRDNRHVIFPVTFLSGQTTRKLEGTLHVELEKTNLKQFKRSALVMKQYEKVVI